MSTKAVLKRIGDFVVPSPVHETFQAHAVAQPEQTAVRFGDEYLAYAGLNAMAEAVAARLLAAGLEPEGLVAIWMDRHPAMLAAILGILKAGGAYLPLDPAHPLQRTRAILDDASPRIVLTDADNTAQLPAGDFQVLPVPRLLEGPRERLALPRVGPHALAYVIYTSGSTGRPKGVQIEHGGLSNLLEAMRRELEIDSRDVFGAATTICFDIAGLELLLPLATGASVAIFSRGDDLAAAMDRHEVTVMQATPSRWRMLIDNGWRGRGGLKILCGGEPMTERLRGQLLDRGDAVWNLYGPTEATIWATSKRVTRDDGAITIGRPLPNYECSIVDGELCISGIGVARGYLNRPELTRDRFILHPNRLYRTGDQACWTPEGEIRLLGRIDHQVKIRGYRIELGDIEQALERHPAIRQAVAAVFDDGEEQRWLVAYCLFEPDAALDEHRLRAHAQLLLPPEAVPARFVPVQSFAVSPSGKVDRRSLPRPDFDSAAGSGPETAAGSFEGELLAIWREALRRPDIGLDDDFFDLGGHSLLAARIFARIAAQFGRSLPLGAILQHSTVRRLAVFLRVNSLLSDRHIVPLQAAGALPPLYVVHHIEGDVLIYRDLANCLAGRRPVFGIEAPADLPRRPDLHSMEALAALYIAELIEMQPVGPYHLAGYSTGGVIAYEIAQQLRRQGREVGRLLLLDADLPVPATPTADLSWLAKTAVRKGRRFVYRFRTMHLADMWRDRVSYRRLQSGADLTLRSRLFAMERAYRPDPYPLPAVLVRATGEFNADGPDPTMGWRAFIANLELCDVPGSHNAILHLPGVIEIARLLDE